MQHGLVARFLHGCGAEDGPHRAREAGLERIGHFGLFQNHVGPKLWESYLLPELATDVA